MIGTKFLAYCGSPKGDEWGKSQYPRQSNSASKIKSNEYLDKPNDKNEIRIWDSLI